MIMMGPFPHLCAVFEPAQCYGFGGLTPKGSCVRFLNRRSFDFRPRSPRQSEIHSQFVTQIAYFPIVSRFEVDSVLIQVAFQVAPPLTSSLSLCPVVIFFAVV